MPRNFLFDTKVFYKTSRTQTSEQEQDFISKILERHQLDTGYSGIEILLDYFFGTIYLVKYIDNSFLVRLTLNDGLWATGDKLCKLCEPLNCIFFEKVASGKQDQFEYAVFASFGPRFLTDCAPEEKILFSQFLGSAQEELLKLSFPELELPSLIEAYDNYFDLCSTFMHVPAGAEKQFKRKSPISVDGLLEFVSLVREDFIETLNNLPEPPRELSSICLGPVDSGYVFYDPFLRFLPTMFPYYGDPYVDMAVNTNLLLFSPDHATNLFAYERKDLEETKTYMRYLCKELWQPTIVPQLLKKFIDLSFSEFPNKSIVSSSVLYSRFCRARLLNSDKYKKFSKQVDSFFLTNIIY